jgi:UDP-3-O-[3-hydroxymyristoyl] glucosamine N-acyltransferase
LHVEGREVSPGLTVAEGCRLAEDLEVDGEVWIGAGVEIGERVRLMGPVVLGDGVRVGAGAQLRASIAFPGTEVAGGAILIDAIAGHAGILASLRRRPRGEPTS